MLIVYSRAALNRGKRSVCLTQIDLRGTPMDRTNKRHDPVFLNAKKIVVIAIFLYAIVKQLFFFAFVDIEYWLPRGVINVAMVTLAFFLTRGDKLTSRQMSWMVPVSCGLLEITGATLTNGDTLIYTVLVGCALLSLMFADAFGLAVTMAVSSAGVALCLFLFGFSLSGETYSFEHDVFHFLGMVALYGIIFSIGKYTIETIRKIRHEKEVASAKIEAIVGNLPKGMVYQHRNNSPEYTITFVGNGSKELTGYTAEELVGGKNKFMEMVHPDDLEDIAKKTAQTLDVGLPCELTYRIIMQDGSIK